MAMITDLTPQKRNKERVNVYLDGEYAFSLALINGAKLQIGQTLSAQEVENLKEEDIFERAMQGAYRFLSYRPRSAYEVQLNLQKKGFESNLIDEVIERLKELEFIDDHAFAEYWVEQREAFKPRSKWALGQELRQKGISSEIIQDVIQNVDDLSAAQKSVEKISTRHAQLSDEELFLKLNGYLQRRGFRYEVISIVIKEQLIAIKKEKEKNDKG